MFWQVAQRELDERTERADSPVAGLNSSLSNPVTQTAWHHPQSINIGESMVHELRTQELFEILEVAVEMGDDDTRQIIEAELFHCEIPIRGGRDD